MIDCDHPWATQDEIGRPYCQACGKPWGQVRKEEASMRTLVERLRWEVGELLKALDEIQTVSMAETKDDIARAAAKHYRGK
jgi:hypothetical protein